MRVRFLTLEIEYDLESLIQTTGVAPARGARDLIVLELYREHRISSGKAASLLGGDRVDFLACASKLGVPWFDMSPEEFDLEVAATAGLTSEMRL